MKSLAKDWFSTRSLLRHRARCGAAVVGLLLGLSGLAAHGASGAPSIQQPAPVRILPLGDSITTGVGAAGGYRASLYARLVNAGYAVDFVGTKTSNGAAGLPDSDHEGHNGFRMDQLNAGLDLWLDADPDPDVVLLLIGTNDFAQNYDLANATNRLENLIVRVATARPYARILVSNLLLRTDDAWTEAAIQAQFNPYIPGIVTRQAALGRRVTFVDLRSLVGAADLADGVHPNQSGYTKLAGGWFKAITGVIGRDGSNDAPALYRAVGQPGGNKVCVFFTKPVADSVASPLNFTVSGGVRVLGAALDPVAKRVVTLTTTAQTALANYNVTVNRVTDRARTARIARNLAAAFTGSRPRGAVGNVAEAAGYTLVYALEVPSGANYGTQPPAYAVDRHTTVLPFSRVAYYLELATTNSPLRFVWVSMTAPVPDARRLGVPTVASGAFFQQAVANMNVVSSVPGIVNGTGLGGGYLEFWPGGYTTANTPGVPGASNTLFDWGDTPVAGDYGSMQIHNVPAGQTLLSFNRWGGTGGAADVGIGNNPVDDPDWTLSGLAPVYPIKAIQVFVKP